MEGKITDLEKYRILVIDAEATSRLKLRYVLEREEAEVREAASGEEALALCLSWKPDLILLEVILKGEDGFQLCRRLQNTVKEKSLPVIMVTWLDDDQSIEMAFAAGVVDFFSKPFNSALLKHRILWWREQEKKTKHLKEADQRQPEPQWADIIYYLPDATMVIDCEGKVIAWNRLMEEMTGVRAEKILGKGKYEYAIPFYGNRRPMLADLLLQADENLEKEYYFLQMENNSVVAEPTVPRLKGKSVFLWVKATRFYDRENNLAGAIESIRDISKERRLDGHLPQLSLRDSLTGFYNRAYFLEELQRLQNIRFSPAGIIMVAVDGLRFINETLGYETGDILLVKTAEAITKCSGETDILARVGGNEMAILLANTSRPVLERFRRRILETVDRYNDQEGKLLFSAAVGFAFRGAAAKSMTDLFQEAENHMYQEKTSRLDSVRQAMVQKFTRALDTLDYLAEGHGERIQQMALRLAAVLRLPEHRVHELRLLANYHDLGKVGVPERILMKPHRLTSEERLEMQKHAEIGYRLALGNLELVSIAEYILKHHEWWNGEGYPSGLKGEEIPLLCRICAIAEAFEVMLSGRPYRPALSREEAFAELRRGAGTQFDPGLVEKFIDTWSR